MCVYIYMCVCVCVCVCVCLLAYYINSYNTIFYIHYLHII